MITNQKPADRYGARSREALSDNYQISTSSHCIESSKDDNTPTIDNKHIFERLLVPFITSANWDTDNWSPKIRKHFIDETRGAKGAPVILCLGRPRLQQVRHTNCKYAHYFYLSTLTMLAGCRSALVQSKYRTCDKDKLTYHPGESEYLESGPSPGARSLPWGATRTESPGRVARRALLSLRWNLQIDLVTKLDKCHELDTLEVSLPENVRRSFMF
jgi:hypothetical protein